MPGLTYAQIKDAYRTREPSPRVRQALLLHSTGTAKSKAEAADLVGLDRQYFYQMTTMSEPTQRLAGEIEQMIKDETISTATVIEKLGRKALGKIASLMETGKEETQLRAAQDLADRAPDTQRKAIQPTGPGAFSIGAADVAALAAALVESERYRREHAHAAAGVIDINVEERQLEQPKYLPPSEPNNG